MTNEELFHDLKQFIAATVKQEIAPLTTKIDSLGMRVDHLERRIDHFGQKLDQVQDAIADAISSGTEEADKTLRDHETRLRRLEHRAA